MKKILLYTSIILVAARIALPYILLHQTNRILADMDDYSGYLEDLNVQLYKGGIQFEDLKIEKVKAKVKEPFVQVDFVDASIDWDAVWQGKFAGEINVTKPIINFAIDSTGADSQTGEEINWVELIDELIPIEANLNKFEIKEGEIKYSDYSTSPQVSVNLSAISVIAKNLSNVKSLDQELPASLSVSGKSDGNGQLFINAKLDYLKQIPDFDLDFELKEVELSALNLFIKTYGNLDVEEGKVSLFSEVLMKDGSYDGYVKPIFEDVKIFDAKKDKDDPFFQKVWEGAVSIPAEIFENQPKDRVATKSPIKGSINKTDVSIFTTIKNVVINAFIDAIPKQLDHTINSNND